MGNLSCEDARKRNDGPRSTARGRVSRENRRASSCNPNNRSSVSAAGEKTVAVYRLGAETRGMSTNVISNAAR